MEGYEIMALIEVVVRWTHVFAAILWIGQTYLFNFFEKNLEANSSDKNISGNLWMVHGGGFYLVEKQRMPEIMPMTLHWFKWEAAATWISGAVLITLTYYMGGYLVESGMNYTTGMAAGISVIFGSWVVYDMMVRSPIGKNEVLFSLISLMLLMVVHYGLTHVLSSRAAFIHIGALVGTIMAANVWMRILPSQRKMIEATRQGRQPDQTLMATGPLRSKHNSYMVTSLILIMISNHYPTLTYGHRFSTFILAVLIVAGWGVARLFRK